jgi:hypothetical protein
MIGEHLARRGVVTLLPDKRGTGDSTGDWRTAGFEELAGDIVAAIASLEQRPEVDPGSIGVVGLSQGGFYAPLVANRSDRISFVVTVSSSLLPFADTVNHEMRNTFRKEGLSGAELEQAMAVQYAAIEVARGGKWQEYERVRREAMAAVPSDAIAGFPAEPDHWICAWAPKVVNWDPLVQWRAVSRPMFFAFGADDEEDNVPVQASLALIRKELEPGRNVTVRVYPDSGHALWDPVRARRGEGVVRNDFIVDLASWIVARSSRAAD